MLACGLLASAHAQPDDDTPLPVWRLAPVEFSGLRQPTQRLVPDQDEFNRLWALLWANARRPPQPPVVDAMNGPPTRIHAASAHS